MRKRYQAKRKTKAPKRAYQKLVQLSTTKDTDKLINYINKNRTAENSDGFLYDLAEYASDENRDFIIHLDRKSPVEELEEYVKEIMNIHHRNQRVQVPSASHYDEEASVNDDGIFDDFDTALRTVGLQFGFFDTEWDDYLIVIHQKKDREKMAKIGNDINYNYYECRYSKDPETAIETPQDTTTGDDDLFS